LESASGFDWNHCPQSSESAAYGTAKPPPEPAARLRKGEGRRVTTTLPTEHFIRFKVYAVQHGLTGEQAIAVERLIAED
jgi:hypothetical protein